MAEHPPSKAGASRLMRIVLVASLALNLAIAGLFVGSTASGRWAAGPPANFDVGLGPMGRALEDEERREIRQSLVRDGAIRQLNLRGRMGEMISVMQTEPFDPDAIGALLAEQLAKTSELQGNVHVVLLQVISDMTPERRAAFAAQLREDMSREPSPQRDGPTGDRPPDNGPSGG